MPRPKVYREYFPSCIERFFGGGKPRRIKARCFVPYTEAEENTEVFLGPSAGAPNIDLNMMLCKEPKKPVNDGYGSIEEGVGFSSMPEETGSQRRDCGCKCRCSDTSSSTYSSSTTCCCSSYSRTTKTASRPKILVLEDDGRYKEVSGEFIGVHRVPERNRVRRTASLKRAKLIARETKMDVIYPSMPSPESSTPPSSEIFPWDDCAKINDLERPEVAKKGVVLGYVMFDPESEDKKLYVTTTDGKRITPTISTTNRS